jgi:hypothetical protein
MDDTNWFNELTTEESKEERASLAQRLIVGLGVVCLIVLVGIATAQAAPLYSAEVEGVRIVLTDEDCKLTAVANLKKRATWTEKGKTFEGCFGLHPQYGVVIAYFSDKHVVLMDPQAFVRVPGV